MIKADNSIMKKFSTFKKFNDIDSVKGVIEILKEHNIPFEIEDNSRQLQEIIIGIDTEPRILLKINPDDFEKANELLASMAENDIENAENDYYLFSFTNEELFEIIAEPEAWCEYDFKLAKKILNSRGIALSSSVEKLIRDKRKKEIAKKEETSLAWKIFGYLMAFFGGIIGIAIGLSLLTGKKTLQNGKRVYMYSEKDRKHGMIITIIGIIMAILWCYFRFIK
jgi:hypothetical protein